MLFKGTRDLKDVLCFQVPCLCGLKMLDPCGSFLCSNPECVFGDFSLAPVSVGGLQRGIPAEKSLVVLASAAVFGCKV